MAAGLLCTALAITVYVRGTPALRKWAGRFAVTLALLLHATVSESAIGLLNCEVARLPRSAFSSLDGYADYSPPSAIASQLADVLLLKTDPFCE